MKKIISLVLVIVLCVSIGATAFAAFGDSTEPQALITWQKTISSGYGIYITVTLSINDSNGDIAGVQGYYIHTPYPNGIGNAYVTGYITTPSYVLFSLAVFIDGVYHPDSAYCYNNF